MFFKNIRKKNLFVSFSLAIMLIGGIAGSLLVNESTVEGFSKTTNEVDFFKIFVQNIFFSLALILGAFTFNILTVCCCLYNGVIFGMYFKSSFVHMGLTDTLWLVLPHTIIELFWISYSLFISNTIFKAFGTYVLESDRFTRFGFVIIKQLKYFLVIIFLVFISCIVEYFITFKIFVK